MDIALIGDGILAKRFYDIIDSKKNDILRSNNIYIKYILVDGFKECLINSYNLTKNFEDIISDNDIKVVIETTDSKHSYDYIRRSLEAGKNVITSSIYAISHFYNKLEELAINMHTGLYIEASIASGIPIISNLINMSNERINVIKASLDGTFNYALSYMQDYHVKYNNALGHLYNEGIIDFSKPLGLEMIDKMAILSIVCFKTFIDVNNISYSTANFTDELIEVANLLNYKVKFLGISSFNNDKISIDIAPMLIKDDALFSNIKGNHNIIKFEYENNNTNILAFDDNIENKTKALISDLIYVISNNKFRPIIKNNYNTVIDNYEKNRYLIKLKPYNEFNQIERQIGNFIISNYMSKDEINNLKDKFEICVRIVE